MGDALSKLKVVLQIGRGITPSALPAAELAKVLVGVVLQSRRRNGRGSAPMDAVARSPPGGWSR